MHEVKYAFAIFLRRLPWFLVVAGGISTLAILTAISLPPAYVSQVRLLVESSQIPGDLAESTVQTSAQEQLQIFETRLLTRRTCWTYRAEFRCLKMWRNCPQTRSSMRCARGQASESLRDAKRRR